MRVDVVDAKVTGDVFIKETHTIQKNPLAVYLPWFSLQYMN